MKRVAAAVLLACAAPAAADPLAHFSRIEYRNLEPGTPGPGQYRNPILAGFYPDPSIVRVGRDFYLVNSSFAWFPGIPVWHSRDLVHWRQIGNAIDRADQLDFSGLGLSRGVFAPDISYHDGRFFIVNTCVDCGGNFVLTARDPRGPWSKPVWLRDVGGIDPSLFFDSDGSAWLVNNREPEGPALYPGHRAIWLQRFDPVALKTIGPARMIVDGGTDLAVHPAWIEGPHLFTKDGAYYLIAAEGGTAEAHSEVAFRADRIEGPYRPAPAGVNPILTQRDLDPARRDPITSAGHAEFVRLANGDWWSILLATRPYAGNLYNTGRETFLLPVTWQNGWPVVLPHRTAIPVFAKAPPLPRDTPLPPPTTGSFVERPSFAGPALPANWLMMRAPAQRWWHLGADLGLAPRAERIGDGKQPSFLGHRQQSPRATLSATLRFVPEEGQSAGLAAVQNDHAFLAIALTRDAGRIELRVTRRAGAADPGDGVEVAHIPAPPGPLQLRITADGPRYRFDYAAATGAWRTLADVDGTNLSTAKAGGFVGTVIGPFAESSRGAAPIPLKE